MGELHLEIIKDRILNHYKVQASMGKVMISYRSTLVDTVTEHLNVHYEMGGKKHSAKLTLTVSPGISGFFTVF